MSDFFWGIVVGVAATFVIVSYFAFAVLLKYAQENQELKERIRWLEERVEPPPNLTFQEHHDR